MWLPSAGMPGVPVAAQTVLALIRAAKQAEDLRADGIAKNNMATSAEDEQMENDERLRGKKEGRERVIAVWIFIAVSSLAPR